jgi:hypothetical protein
LVPSVNNLLYSGHLAFWILAGEDSIASAHETSTLSPSQSSSQLNTARKGVKAVEVAEGEDTSELLGDDNMLSASPPTNDIWTLDPYVLAAKCRPGLMHGRNATEASRHRHSFQCRVLARLALAVREAGGKEGLSQTYVVLSINDDQQEEATRLLWDNQFYGWSDHDVSLHWESDLKPNMPSDLKAFSH